MTISKYIVRASGLYGIDEHGREYKLEGCPRVTANNGVAFRIPARDVTVEAPLDVGAFHDCTDIARGYLLVVLGGVALAAISAVRPGVAAVIQNQMTTNGTSPGAVD